MGTKLVLAGVTLAAVAGYAAARHYEIPQQITAYRTIAGDARIEFCATAVRLHYDDYQGLRMLSARTADGDGSEHQEDVAAVKLRYSVANALGVRRQRFAECLFSTADAAAAPPFRVIVGTQMYSTQDEIETVVERVEHERYMSR